jgi:hypothetical protein
MTVLGGLFGGLHTHTGSDGMDQGTNQQKDSGRTALWVDSPLAPAVKRFAAEYPYVDINWGDPGSVDGWFRYEDLCDQKFADRILERYAAASP